VDGHSREPEVGRVHGELKPGPLDRPPRLELVDGQVDARPVEGMEGAVHSVGADESLDIAGLAAGMGEEPGVRAPRVGVDALADEVDEVRLAAGEPVLQRRSSLGGVDRVP